MKKRGNSFATIIYSKNIFATFLLYLDKSTIGKLCIGTSKRNGTSGQRIPRRGLVLGGLAIAAGILLIVFLAQGSDEGPIDEAQSDPEQVLTEDLYQLAELMVISLNGYVSPEAEALFRKVLAKDNDNGGALYYLGLMYANLDRPDLSFEIWRKLLNRGPDDAPWVPLIRQQIMEVAWRAGKNRYELPAKTIAPPNGPTQADIEASNEMTADERQEMISNMVEGLASRLASEGGTSDEWARLIKALSVLGESDRAKKIWAEALNIYNNSQADLRVINDIAKEIGISR